MGRPEPCVLFAQTFVHPQLDEYVDEVIFSEPVVIAACEFLEQNATSASPAVTLIGATSPPSFALEVFVQCEGETRFRRLCHPFLYSHSSSNVLEVEAVVTAHLVVRGSYRSLSLVIYGNTAEDLGQFNIEVDLDSSLTNPITCVEGGLEDLPPALHPSCLTIEESISPLKVLCLEFVPSDISVEIKQFLVLILKVLEFPDLGNATDKVIDSVVSAASKFATYSFRGTAMNQKQFTECGLEGQADFNISLTEAKKELLDICKSLQHESDNLSADSFAESSFLECEPDLATSKILVEILSQHFQYTSSSGNVGYPQLSQKKNAILWLSVALLLCSGRESCFQFVNAGGMEQLGYVFSNGMLHSTAAILMLLGVIEQATRHSVGCEGFLGWWPREDENIPSGISEGYNQLLKLLLQKQRHDVASLATYILHRMRLYEVASRYECAVLSVLGSLSAAGRVTSVTLDMLSSARLQLRKLLKLIDSRGPIEDPSPVSHARRSLILGESGPLSYKATSSLITSSNCCFSNWDLDSHLLLLLKERGFLPLSAALLSSSVLRSEAGYAMDLFVDITSYIEAIILSLLFCRSGLIFLLLDSDLSATIIHALRGADDLKKKESVPIRYASLLISKGYFCHPQDIGMIVETHLRVVNAVDCLITPSPHTEESLWVLWELCSLSRSHCGRQALLALGYFPEAISFLLAALHPVKELDPVPLNTGAASPLSLAILHSAAEIFEVIVTDSTASSLASWIEHARELHRSLHSSSPGSNRKDAPARLLEWIDAGVVYHKNGALGLLRYAAVLASGGDAHVASTSILSSEVMDVENVVGDSSSDGNVIETLIGKPITRNEFSGVALRDSSVAQLATGFRILAFVSDNPAVAAAMYDEGAIMVVHAVLMDCRVMLERSSNNYDYLVDEGAECNSTSDILLERNREQSIVDLLIPSLVLLINLLHTLQEAKEQHRNTKLMNSLLQLHRELSPKLAACVADLSYPYPDFLLSFEAVCHLLVSALACWPLYGWNPSLFHFLLNGLHATSLLALGPKETCSLLCLLNDLFPEEGVWLWNDGVPMLTTTRKLAVGTLLGPRKERQINWYLQPGLPEKLLGQLKQQLEKIGQIILHCAISTLVVIQDMLRVFVIRVACLNADYASMLLQPIVKWIFDHTSEPSSLSDTEVYKVYKYLDFLAILLEHPCAKPLLLKEGAVQMYAKLFEECLGACNSDEKQFLESRSEAKYGFTELSWCIPIFRSIPLIMGSGKLAKHSLTTDGRQFENVTAEDCSLFLSYLLRLCKELPVGKELLACLSAFNELGSCNEARSALLSIWSHTSSSGSQQYDSESRHEHDGNNDLVYATEWRRHPPLLCCWMTLLRSLDPKDVPPAHVIEAVGALSSGALRFCIDGESLNLDRVFAIKRLFGLPYDTNSTDDFSEDNTKYIHELASLLEMISSNEYSSSDMSTTLGRVKESVKLFSFLMQKPTESVKEEEDVISGIVHLSGSNMPVSSKIRKIGDTSAERVEKNNLGGFAEKFLWECPESLRDRLSQIAIPSKRKVSSLEATNRRPRGDNGLNESMVQSPFSRGSGPSSAPPGPTRRDSFRQRKPNTSRPPSMHVDDYVARERNTDGPGGSNVISIPRAGSTGGRPPSIHVDEFMARQRERQNPVGLAASNAAAAQEKTAENVADAEKSSKTKTLKPDIDDDLQGIDIVFDGEESDSDDKLPFPQIDDGLKHMVGQNSPHSIVEETESDANGSIQSSHVGNASNDNADNTQSEFSSRMSVSRPKMPLIREPSISSDKKYNEQPENTKNVQANTSGIPSGYSKPPVEPRMPPSNFYSKNGPPQSGMSPMGTGLQGFYDPKFHLNQPPLPPTPPPALSAIPSQAPDSVPRQSSPFANTIADPQPQFPPGFYVQPDYQSQMSSNPMPQPSSMPMPDSKYARPSLSSSPGGTVRPNPPLPPTPPPYISNMTTLPSFRPPISHSSPYNQTTSGPDLLHTSVQSSSDSHFANLYPPQPLMPPLLFNRPNSMPFSMYGENPSSMSQSIPIQLQPLQPPQQLPRPPPHRPPIPASPQSDHGVPPPLLQNPVQVQMQQLQMMQQQAQVSPAHAYFQNQTPQHDGFSNTPPHFSNTPPRFPNTPTPLPTQQQGEPAQHQILPQQVEVGAGGTSREQTDSGMSLQDYFSSPEAIQALLSDRDKLCQLLEQHPKLMQMLQERLGQL